MTDGKDAEGSGTVIERKNDEDVICVECGMPEIITKADFQQVQVKRWMATSRLQARTSKGNVPAQRALRLWRMHEKCWHCLFHDGQIQK
ncbi:hypothetical protein [Paenibacillus radicis (ex Xue et al. 2023)]|uniref:hypothetical protein n=1 Tax=Paenibacillus radicis (ex Xue et al. 2023) TaxID=2972489 RepID=UPI002E20DB18